MRRLCRTPSSNDIYQPVNRCMSTHYFGFWDIVSSNLSFGIYTAGRSVALFFIGLFCAFLPVPSQMLIAASMALIGRCNIAISVAVTWVTNPLTIGPMFFFAYKLGAWLLDTQVTITGLELSWAWLSNQIGQIWWPLLAGCLICGWVSGLSGMLVSRMLWRLHIVRRWKQRLGRREKPVAS